MVHTGGASETAWVWTADGGVLAVMRNEAGEGDEFGSYVCRAEPEALGDWSCRYDPRKYDSPLLFQEAGRTWLVGRRTLGNDGLYDLDQDDLTHEQQYYAYQVNYWDDRKRCSLWEVDGEELTVSWVLDLPSAGDTCFPDDRSLGDGLLEIWNYSSPLDGGDPSWLDGQLGPTQITRTVIDFSAAG